MLNRIQTRWWDPLRALKRKNKMYSERARVRAIQTTRTCSVLEGWWKWRCVYIMPFVVFSTRKFIGYFLETKRDFIFIFYHASRSNNNVLDKILLKTTFSLFSLAWNKYVIMIRNTPSHPASLIMGECFPNTLCIPNKKDRWTSWIRSLYNWRGASGRS